eukprot:Nk52_evm1s2041 gene=Nk52_evmTU1s2041
MSSFAAVVASSAAIGIDCNRRMSTCSSVASTPTPSRFSWSTSFSSRTMDAHLYDDPFSKMSLSSSIGSETSGLCRSFENEFEHSSMLPVKSYAQDVQVGEITAYMRESAAKVMLKISDLFDLDKQTFFLSVTYLDRFLSRIRIKTKHLNILSIACLWIAAKFHEEPENVPYLSELVEVSGFSFTVKEVARLEKEVLAKLEWKLNATTGLDFLHQYCEVVSDFLLEAPSFTDFSNKVGVISESDFLAAKSVFSCPSSSGRGRFESVLKAATQSLEGMVCSYSMIHYKPSVLAIVALYWNSCKKDSVLSTLRKCIPRASLEDLDKCISSNQYVF